MGQRMKKKHAFIMASLVIMLITSILIFRYLFSGYPFDDNKPTDNTVEMFVDVAEGDEEDDYKTAFSVIETDPRFLASDQWLIQTVTDYSLGFEPDIDSLVRYYLAAEDFKMLYLFDLRFHENLTTAEEFSIARQTAQSLARYLYEERGEDALFEPLSDTDRNGWLQSIGIERAYFDPYNGYLDEYRVISNHPLKIKSENATYNINDNFIVEDQDIESFSFDTAERIELFLYRDAFGKEYLMNWLKENAGEGFKEVAPPIRIEYLLDSSYNISTAGGGIIRLNSVWPYLHEYVHIIFPVRGREGSMIWNVEGFAEYLSEMVAPFPYAFMSREDRIKEYGFGATYFSGEQAEVAEPLIRERYLSYIETEEIISLDPRLVYDAITAVLMSDVGAYLLEGCGPRLLPINQRSINKRDQKNPGNELSYYGAASFVAWLIDIYSLETAIQIARPANPDLVSIFGKDYEELRNEWLAYLNR